MNNNYVSDKKLIVGAGLSGNPEIGRACGNLDDMPSLPERIRQILGIVLSNNRKPGHMICFIMYDISSNKVRTLVAKYLLGKGCTRVQKSIFMADLATDTYQAIGKNLAEIQKMYDNEDSILIVPLSEDYAKAMRIIGQQVDIDLIMHTKNTLFF